MPEGVMPAYSRFTSITPLHMGMSAMIAMKHPQLVIGLSISE